MTQETLIRLECIRCGAGANEDEFHLGCLVCTERNEPANITTIYDLEKARDAFLPETLAKGPNTMWRYEGLMPFSLEQAVTMDEGGTPLVKAPRLADRLGVRTIWIKDESRNPTWSFKDRAMAMAATHARLRRTPAIVVSSTGNAAAAASAYARRAGMPAIVLFAKSVDSIMSAFVQSYNPHIVVTETKLDRWKMMQYCVEEWGCYPAGNYVVPPVGVNPYMSDGYRTVGFEIWEQLGRRAPDWIFLPVGYSNCLFGVFRAFQDLQALGFADMPHLGAAEAYGSLSRAVEENLEVPPPMEITIPTVAISMGTFQNTYQGLLAVRESNGSATQITDEGVLSAQRLLAESEGIFGETASLTGLAAMIQRIEAGEFDPDSEVVIVLTSSGVKTIGVTSDPDRELPMAVDKQQFAEALENEYGFIPT